jgi:hypothetical protein
MKKFHFKLVHINEYLFYFSEYFKYFFHTKY